jgi:carotenoid cleavage dioxygenase-like enzyme
MKKPFTYASRQEIEIELLPIEGTIPTDMFGHVFMNSPCGTVNNTLPMPEYYPDGTKNSEYGEMMFNGDAMLFRFDLDKPGRVSVKSSLLKPPCYYADYASRYGTEYFKQGINFKGMGLARTSMHMGSRNQLNTSINLFKFKNDKNTRVSINFDAGRFYELDAKSMILKTPIGSNKEWTGDFPNALEYTFPLVLSTAHPSFDPITKELFTVNYLKSASNLAFGGHRLFGDLPHEHDLVTEHVQKLYADMQNRKIKSRHIPGLLIKFFDFLKNIFKKNDSEKTFDPFDVEAALKSAEGVYKDIFGMENAVYLLRWTGSGPLEKWRVLNEKGEDLYIAQCMHQTNISKDYIVLVDSSVKFTLDIMFSDPFPKAPWLDELLRWITTNTMLPETPLYIINRKDLLPESKTITAKSFTIPLETVHYSMDYDNTDNLITLHTAHNTASCAAEWIRPYDTLAVDPHKPVHKNTISLMTCGEMDIGRIGKFIVDGETGKIVEQYVVHSKGFDGENALATKAHTWAVGLNTYRNIISAEKPVNKIRKNYWQSYGLDKRMLTHFIWRLYKNYKNRIIPADELLEYTRHGVPFCLFREDVETMDIDNDFWLFQMNENLRSVQFVPRNRPNGIPEGVDPDMDGYILCSMVNGSPDLDNDLDEYSREIWFFDAAELSKGPVCKLQHPDLQFAFTIHSAWSPDCESSNTSYNIPVREDYDYVISNFPNQERQKDMREFMEKNVYPFFENKDNTST